MIRFSISRKRRRGSVWADHAATELYEGSRPGAIKLPGSDRWRFRPSDLEAYVKAGELSPKHALVSEAEGGDGEAA